MFEQIIIATIAGIVLMVVGSFGTGIIWVARYAWQIKVSLEAANAKIMIDLNAAHEKIRVTDKHLECLERAFYFQGDEDGDHNRYYREPSDSSVRQVLGKPDSE